MILLLTFSSQLLLFSFPVVSKKIYLVVLVYISSPPLLRAGSRSEVNVLNRHVERKGRVLKYLEGTAVRTRFDHYGNTRYSAVPRR